MFTASVRLARKGQQREQVVALEGGSGSLGTKAASCHGALSADSASTRRYPAQTQVSTASARHHRCDALQIAPCIRPNTIDSNSRRRRTFRTLHCIVMHYQVFSRSTAATVVTHRQVTACHRPCSPAQRAHGLSAVLLGLPTLHYYSTPAPCPAAICRACKPTSLYTTGPSGASATASPSRCSMSSPRGARNGPRRRA